MSARTRRARIVTLLLATVLAFACQDDAAKLSEHMSRGDAYLEDGKHAEAVIEYKNALQIDPNLGPAHYGLAKAYLGQKEARKAYWELQETVRLDPSNIDAKVEFTQFLLFGKEDELNRAVSLAGEVLTADPSRWQAHVLKGRALQALRRPDEARDAYAEAVKLAPEEGAPLLLLANFYRERGDREAAEPLFQKLTEIEGNLASYTALGGFLAVDRTRDVEAEAAYRKGLEVAEGDQRVAAYSLLANFLLSRDRAAEAEALLRDGIEKEERSRELSYALARYYNAKGEPAKADAIIAAAAETDPTDPDPYLVLSSYRGKRGDLPGALEAAEKALEAKPDHNPAKLRKAELLIDLGFRNGDRESSDEGRAIVEAILAGEPTNPQALLVSGKLALAEERFDDAERSLRQAIDGRADWPQAHFLLGSTLFLQRDFLSARAEVTRAIELDASFTEAERVLARIEVALGEDERAAEIGQRALRRAPDDDKLRVLVAQSLVRLDRADEAKRMIEAIPEDRRDAEAHYALGRIALFENRSEEARRHLMAGHAVDSTRYEILRSLLDLDIRERRLEESAERIRAAVRAKPEDSRLTGLQGEVLLYSGDTKGSEEAFRRAIQQNPNDLEAYSNFARYLVATGRPDEVLAAYEEALAQNPDSGVLNLIVGSLYEINARVDDAIASYERAVKLDPNLAVAKNNLAYLLAERKGSDLDRALDLAQEAREALPENPNAADTLGWVLYKKDLPGAAVGYLREAERSMGQDDPQTGIVRHHLALALEANGESEAAREVLARAIKEIERITMQGDKKRPEPAFTKDLRAMLDRLGGPPADTANNEG